MNVGPTHVPIQPLHPICFKFLCESLSQMFSAFGELFGNIIGKAGTG